MELHDGIGRRVREIRLWRRKSLRAVAELAGISESHLSNIEHGRRSLDRRSLIIALANALDVAPSTLGAPPGSGPNGGPTARAVEDVRRVLIGADLGQAGGVVCPLPELQQRSTDVLMARQQCRDEVVGAALPTLLADLHASAARDPGVLRWLVLVSVHATQGWLRDVGAPLDLSWRAAIHAQAAADRLGSAETGAVAAFGVARDLIAAGSVDLAARRVADVATQIGTTSRSQQQLSGVLALTASMAAAAARRPDDTVAPLQVASELADRTGSANEWWFDFSPANVAIWRMGVALEVGDVATAVQLAEAAQPDQLTARSRRSAFLAEYGRALAHVRGRVDDACRALRQAEDIYPARVRRNPFSRETVLYLLPRARSTTAQRELRGLAYRMGIAA